MTAPNNRPRQRTWPLPTVRSIRAAFWAYVIDVAPKYNTRRNRSVSQNDLPVELRVLWVDWLDAQCRDGNVSPMIARKVTL